MSTYVILARFTDQGIRSVKETTKRADALKELAKSFGGTIKLIYWTLGHYDVVTIVEVPDDASLTAMLLSIGSKGNVRTEALRAFSADEIGKILAKTV